MKILIINPNSSVEMSAAIQNVAEIYANGDFEVKTVPTPNAPEYIDYYIDQAIAAPGMMQIVKENEAEYDAFIVACHCDPNLDLLKQITDKPVVGIGEASMKLATMLGHSFSVVSAGKHSIPNKRALIHKYGLDNDCASVRGPKDDFDDPTVEGPYLNAAQIAMEEDLAEVIVLGCAGMAGYADVVRSDLGMEVIDPSSLALKVTEALVAAGMKQSKRGYYSYPPCMCR
mgnify:CR=1 FL=1